MTPLNSWLMTHRKTFHFQDFCLMLTFGNDYDLVLGIQNEHVTQCFFAVGGTPHLKYIHGTSS
jgi:hypothetical protein